MYLFGSYTTDAVRKKLEMGPESMKFKNIEMLCECVMNDKLALYYVSSDRILKLKATQNGMCL